MLPDWFSLLLEARVKRELMWQLVEWERLDTSECGKYRHESYSAAEDAGYVMRDMPVPLLLKFDEELVEAFEEGQWRRNEEKREAERAEQERLAEARIARLLEVKDWESLSLPSPEELLSELKAGISRKVGGHSLNPDEDGVWITNPYGIDCGLWQEFSLETIEAFLVDMARDVEYGPVPH